MVLGSGVFVMKSRMRRMALAATVIAIGSTGNAIAQAPVPVTGAELEAWFAADQMAVAGFTPANGCHWLTKGPGQARTQTIYCPNSQAFTVVGQARIEGNRLCSKFSYPDGTKYEGCQEIFKVGENKYEARVDGVARNVFYRLIR